MAVVTATYVMNYGRHGCDVIYIFVESTFLSPLWLLALLRRRVFGTMGSLSTASALSFVTTNPNP
jgi:hypothetical protein